MLLPVHIMTTYDAGPKQVLTADASTPCGFSRLGYSATAPTCYAARSAVLHLRTLLLHGTTAPLYPHLSVPHEKTTRTTWGERSRWWAQQGGRGPTCPHCPWTSSKPRNAKLIMSKLPKSSSTSSSLGRQLDLKPSAA